MSFGDFLKSLSFGEALVSSLVIAVFATVSVGIKYFWDKWVLNTVLRNARDLETYNQIEVILTPILDWVLQVSFERNFSSNLIYRLGIEADWFNNSSRRIRFYKKSIQTAWENLLDAINDFHTQIMETAFMDWEKWNFSPQTQKYHDNKVVQDEYLFDISNAQKYQKCLKSFIDQYHEVVRKELNPPIQIKKVLDF